MHWRTIATLLMVAALLVPVVRDGDGVPLSSYPMYSGVRQDTVQFIVPVGLDAAGNAVPLSTQTIADTTDPLIAESFLRDQVRAGRTTGLCQQIAIRANDPTVETIEIRSELHRVVDRALGAPSLVRDEVLASCPTS